ncbi:hypothetical protein [Nocardioides taihuensis]|uniref:Uncharacterized protein n=1 Tax=Nocardioides taihuensis TaxID=1835606 RepID=A0ABW0BFA9_9ACTN
MGRAGRTLRDLPAPRRYALAGAVALGCLGGVVGLVLGLRAHPATAWAAVFEVGIPAAVLGAVVGLLVGIVAELRRRTCDT